MAAGLFVAVLAPFASDGVWAPRLMLLAVGYAAGWDAIPRPHHAPRILRAGFGKEGLHDVFGEDTPALVVGEESPSPFQ